MPRILNYELDIDKWNLIEVPHHSNRFMFQLRSNVATGYIIYEEPPLLTTPPANLDCWSYKSNDIVIEENLTILSDPFKLWIWPSVDGIILELSVWSY